MYALTDNPIDVLLAVVLLAPVVLVGVGAALGWIAEHQTCDCLHCTERRSRRAS
jgi:hypothetical protein